MHSNDLLHWNMRDIVVKRWERCLSEAGKKRWLRRWKSVKGVPVMTAGQPAHPAREGSTIGFLPEHGRIGFEINAEAAQQRRLKISARFLALASKVIGGPKGT